MDIKVCNSHFVFNTINNNGDSVLFIDLRSMYNYLRGHVDFDHLEGCTIPMPVDYMLENDLSIKDVFTWLPKMLTRDQDLVKYNIYNKDKLKNFDAIKRKFVFIIACNTQTTSNFKIEKLFRPKYAQSILNTNKVDKMADYLSMRNAILLIEALAKKNCHRNVYLVKDS